MDGIGSRIPLYTMKGFNKNHEYQLFAISTIGASGSPVIILILL